MNKVAKFLTGFDAVVLGLIVFVAYRYFEVQSLFYRYLPLEEGTRRIASLLVAFVVVFSLLLFSAHIDRFKLSKYGSGEWIKRVLFLFTLLINVFFWEVWTVANIEIGEASMHAGLIIGFKTTIAIFFAVFDYAYNHLFISLWNEKYHEAKLQRSLSELETKENQLKLSISEGSAILSQILARDDPKVCPRCAKEFENSNQRNGHIRACKKSIKPLIVEK